MSEDLLARNSNAPLQQQIRFILKRDTVIPTAKKAPSTKRLYHCHADTFQHIKNTS